MHGFLSACLDAGVPVASYRNPRAGPQGEALFTDAALVGRSDAENVVVVTSSTHGVEGFAGSGIQVGLLRDPRAPKPLPDTALLLVHTINPYGMAWLRRRERGQRRSEPQLRGSRRRQLPGRTTCSRSWSSIWWPRDWNEDAYDRYKAAIGALNERYGEVPVRKAMHKGQYRHPDSIHYGGNEATWSNRTLASICGEFLGEARRGAMIDVHTGLGPYGYGELMTPSKPGERVYDLLFDWYGEQVHSTTAGASDYAGSKGSILAGFRPPVASLEWAAVGLEYGTREREHMRRCMLANAWLHAHGDPDSDLGRAIKRDVKDASYPDEEEWKTLVWERGREVVEIAIRRIGT